MAGRHEPLPAGLLAVPAMLMWGQPPRLSNRAERGVPYRRPLASEVRSHAPPPFVNRPPRLYKSWDRLRARRPLHSRPQFSASRPDPRCGRPAAGRSCPSRPLYQPSSVRESGCAGRRRRHRRSRVTPATPPASRSFFFFRARFFRSRSAPPQRPRSRLRHRRRIRRRPPPQPGVPADRRPRRRRVLRHQRHRCPKRPPQPPPLKWILSSTSEKTLSFRASLP
jgi:hypothetical protein